MSRHSSPPGEYPVKTVCSRSGSAVERQRSPGPAIRPFLERPAAVPIDRPFFIGDRVDEGHGRQLDGRPATAHVGGELGLTTLKRRSRRALRPFPMQPQPPFAADLPGHACYHA